MRISDMHRVASGSKLTGKAAEQFSWNGCAKGTMYYYLSRKGVLFSRFIKEAAVKAVERYRSMKACNTTMESPRELAKSDMSALSEEETIVGAFMDGARTGT